MQNEKEILEKLREGVVFLIITSFLLGVLGVLFLYIVSESVFKPGILGYVLGLSLIEIIGGIIGVRGLTKTKAGFKALMELGKDVRRGYVGVNLYLTSIVLSVLGVFLLPVLIGVPLMFLGVLFVVLGNLFVGLGFYKVGEIYGEEKLMTGGFLAAIPFPVLSFVGYILVYIGLGKVVGNGAP